MTQEAIPTKSNFGPVKTESEKAKLAETVR